MARSEIQGVAAVGEPARLIPVLPESKREERSTSTTLAVINSVDEFGRDLLKVVGAPIRKTSKIRCYSEVEFTANASKKSRGPRPDGLIVIDTGRSTWSALVEAKTGNTHLAAEQIEGYVDVARNNGVDAVLTISNQFSTRPEHHPVKVNGAKLRKVGLFHWSWTYILTEAILHIRNHGISDPDQAYILGELVRFLKHERTGVLSFDQMPSEWKDICGAIQLQSGVNKRTEGIGDVVTGWQELTRAMALEMSTAVGKEVKVHLPRKHEKDPSMRAMHDTALLCGESRLEDYFEVPDAADRIKVEADAAKRTLKASMYLKAPTDRTLPRATVTWLVKQLTKCTDPGSIMVTAKWPGRMPDTVQPLSAIIEDKNTILEPSGRKMPSGFEIALVRDLQGRFNRNRVFVEEAVRILPDFYELAGQYLSQWRPRPPQITRKVLEPSAAESGGPDPAPPVIASPDK